jgi:plasmid replication initiation protein
MLTTGLLIMNKDKNVVTLSHELTRAVYGLSLNEKRILLKGAALLDTYGGSDQILEINAGDCADFYAMEKKGAYGALSAACERLWDRTLLLKDGTRMRWVITSKYQGGSIFLKFHPDLNPHLLDLQTRFTRYLLTRASSFKLMYTWRLFELIMQFKRTGVLRIDLAEFKEILEIPEYYSTDFSRVRLKVIEPAVKEIREKDGLKVIWSPIKKGRTVVALEFKFPVENQVEVFKVDEKSIKENARPGESYEDVKKRLQGGSKTDIGGELPLARQKSWDRLSGAAKKAILKEYGTVQGAYEAGMTIRNGRANFNIR